MYTKKGEVFPLSMRMLHKQLEDDGLIQADTTGGKRTRVKAIAGKGMRLLWVPRINLDGPTVANEQTRITVPPADFAPSSEATPFDKA